MTDKTTSAFLAAAVAVSVVFSACTRKAPVDYVNPYMGSISHLLVPTYPTVHLPYSMLRVYPERADYTGDRLSGLPVAVVSHRGSSTFKIFPAVGRDQNIAATSYSYDNESVSPYLYSVFLDEENVEVRYAPASQAGIYELSFRDGGPKTVAVSAENGSLWQEESGIAGCYDIGNRTRIYLYAESSPAFSYAEAENDGKCFRIGFESGQDVILRYGISFISVEQAKRNLDRDIPGTDIDKVAKSGRKIWNSELSRIAVRGDSEADKRIFYTSFYRTCERMVCISEDGRYFSAFDGKIHDDGGVPFYTDDWAWDSYRAAHPLRTLTDPEREQDMMCSYVRMAEQTVEKWMPTFPEINGDSHRMNGNHAVAIILDGYRKGLDSIDIGQAYRSCYKAITEKSLLPWTRMPLTSLDRFYRDKGYFPALAPGEKETCMEVHPFERRQAVSVMLGNSYDCWCLSEMAKEAGISENVEDMEKMSVSYRNVFNPRTGFFHPKDKEGRFIEPFDPRFSGGLGARDYFCENNAWIYRWDVPHNIADLVALNGGREKFVAALDSLFSEPIGKGKYEFYSMLPDHTGNVGQFSMANEPCLHIPYLYNYAGAPWKTQKRIRSLIDQWFRDDLMGLPGDEDGGGMSAFVVFSMLGFYPVTPGMPVYNIGSPMFKNSKINFGNGKTFTVKAVGCSKKNKYIQSASLNGRPLEKPWFSHKDIANGGKLVLVMGPEANRQWGSLPGSEPPSAGYDHNKL